jgi:hypothetical protein
MKAKHPERSVELALIVIDKCQSEVEGCVLRDNKKSAFFNCVRHAGSTLNVDPKPHYVQNAYPFGKVS